jgi:hypothetical protein
MRLTRVLALGLACAGCADGGLTWNWPMLTFIMTTLIVVGLGIGLARGANFMRRDERREERQERRDDRKGGSA